MLNLEHVKLVFNLIFLKLVKMSKSEHKCQQPATGGVYAGFVEVLVVLTFHLKKWATCNRQGLGVQGVVVWGFHSVFVVPFF